jgi:polar amino acid transport system substrate-binding protein
MKQLIQNLKTGELKVEEVPPPLLKTSGVLVRNVYSLISAGTERSTVKMGQSSLLGKASRRPDLVGEVLHNIQREGMINTYHKVMNRLDTPKALGYSSAGVVIETSGDIEELKPGDRVACAGSDYASHAEVVFIPKNLCIPIPPEVSFREAAFTTLGAIAMQSIRQAEATVGDCVTVIGLGLVGLLTVQILKTSGCQVIGLDINPDTLELAKELGAEKTLLINDPKVEALVAGFTSGYGVDRVIITAATPSNQPVELAGRIVRDRGIIVVVGAVKMDIPRNLYYEKELTVKLSRSYGPGRYDTTYEEKGIDYPIGYIRWTEKRNMAAFLQLIAEKKINLEKMITQVFPIAQATRAYEIITGKTHENSLAILLDYHNGCPEPEKVESRVYLTKNVRSVIPAETPLKVGFIGAGNFAQNYLLPPLKGIKEVWLHGVTTARGINAHAVARKFDFVFCTSNSLEILQDPDIHCVFIATRHNLHANLVVQALEQNKHVFVEKPLALSEAELAAVITAYKNSSGELMVGFNRRFSPLVQKVKRFLHPLQNPLVIHYRVNAGFVPKTHWAQDPIEGGGRILGEVCHFVDLMQYLTDAEPLKVYAEAISSLNTSITDFDNVNITVKFNDGSLGVITYVALGDPGPGKERIEIFGDNATVIIDDFKMAALYDNRKTKKVWAKGKGHREEVEAFISALKAGNSAPIDFKSLVLTTITTFNIHESLNKRTPIYIHYPQSELELTCT